MYRIHKPKQSLPQWYLSTPTHRLIGGTNNMSQTAILHGWTFQVQSDPDDILIKYERRKPHSSTLGMFHYPEQVQNETQHNQVFFQSRLHRIPQLPCNWKRNRGEPKSDFRLYQDTISKIDPWNAEGHREGGNPNFFISQYTNVCLPIYQLQKGNKKFLWKDKCETALQQLIFFTSADDRYI